MAAGLARRGTIILLLAAAYSQSDVAQAVGVQRTVMRMWARHFLAQRLDGLADASGRRARGGCSPEVAIHVVRLAYEGPDTLGRNPSQWHCAELARQLIADRIMEAMSAATLRRFLAAHQLKPWRHPIAIHGRPVSGQLARRRAGVLASLLPRELTHHAQLCASL